MVRLQQMGKPTEDDLTWFWSLHEAIVARFDNGILWRYNGDLLGQPNGWGLNISNYRNDLSKKE
jgi:hypothetical protein